MNLDEVIPQGLTFIAHKGWQSFNLLSFCHESSLDFYSLIQIIPHKEAFLETSMIWIHSHKITFDLDPDLVNLEDQLFESIMERFDDLEPYKAALRNIYQATIIEPCELSSRASSWLHQVHSYFKKRFQSDLPKAFLATALYLKIFPLWLEDNSDLRQTMASLDGTIKKYVILFQKLT
jgi:hypothetical protein